VNALNAHGDSVESIVHKKKVKGKVVLPGQGRKSKLSTAASTFLRRQVQKNTSDCKRPAAKLSGNRL